jgi:group II intron reverse transcriptase/maturase
MNAPGKSDERVVPRKPANEAQPKGVEESVEGRRSAKGNAEQDAAPRTQGRTGASIGLQGVREAARRERRARFTALLHHVTVEWLRESFYSLKKRAAPGVDGVTWQEYEERLDERLADLHERVHRGSYRAQPSRRVYIPKADGRQRPLGIAALEDKIVQHAVGVVLSAIYEEDFLGFSYGFRPGRGQHDALDALWTGIMRKKVNWVLDADIRGFFDTLDHGWLMKFVEHRIADPRVLRLVRKWLRAGVLEEGRWSETQVGTPQGAVISPLLANVYLHYVLDLWVEAWRKKEAVGDVIVVRYADDFVLGFEHREDAERLLRALHVRMEHFGLALHPEKTRLIEFGRFAAERRRRRGEGGRPETFDFLGFTHMSGRSRRGRFLLERKTAAKRLRVTLRAMRERLHWRRHRPIREQGAWLRQVVQGWLNYHAIPGNSARLRAMLTQTARHWMRALRRRSQRHRLTWERFHRIADPWLPRPRVLHPWPNVRFDARHPR